MNTLVKIAELLTNSETDQRILKYYYKLILFNPKIIGKFDINIQVIFYTLIILHLTIFQINLIKLLPSTKSFKYF